MFLQIRIRQWYLCRHHALLHYRLDLHCRASKQNYKIQICGQSFIKLAQKWSSLKVDGEFLWFFFFKYREIDFLVEITPNTPIEITLIAIFPTVSDPYRPCKSVVCIKIDSYHAQRTILLCEFSVFLISFYCFFLTFLFVKKKIKQKKVFSKYFHQICATSKHSKKNWIFVQQNSFVLSFLWRQNLQQAFCALIELRFGVPCVHQK